MLTINCCCQLLLVGFQQSEIPWRMYPYILWVCVGGHTYSWGWYAYTFLCAITW
jgi:hypothetical protein